MSEEKVEEKEVEEGLPDLEIWSFVSHNVVASLRLMIVLLLVCSVLYPALTTGVGRFIWPEESRGSLVRLNGEVVGSRLIGQSFTSPSYFHPRPSSIHYDARESGSANLGPTNPALRKRAADRMGELKEEGLEPEQIPASYLSESGSALDPHISPRAARLQIPRIAQATGISSGKLSELIESHAKGKLWGLFGQKRVNVLSLNMDLIRIKEEVGNG